MSKNAKNSRKLEKARSTKRAKLQGSQAVSLDNPGPAKTDREHNKKNTWYARKDGKFQGKEVPVKKRGDGEGDE